LDGHDQDPVQGEHSAVCPWTVAVAGHQQWERRERLQERCEVDDVNRRHGEHQRIAQENREQRPSDRCRRRRTGLGDVAPHDRRREDRGRRVDPEQDAVSLLNQDHSGHRRDREAEVGRPEEHTKGADPLPSRQVGYGGRSGRAEQLRRQPDPNRRRTDRRHRLRRAERDQRDGRAQEPDQHRVASTDPVTQPATQQLRPDISDADRRDHRPGRRRQSCRSWVR
jgi:hypothetical protein